MQEFIYAKITKYFLTKHFEQTNAFIMIKFKKLFIFFVRSLIGIL